MRKLLLLGAAILLVLYPSWAQQGTIVTHNQFTAQTLVKDIFASGACDNIDLISPIGSAVGLGYFENGSAIIGLDRGIILSTGPTGHARGPNSASDKSGDIPGLGNDTDLERLSAGDVFDAVGIEFDFAPLDSIVTFRYVFASEEYCEFVGSDYNDVFGFFVSGPGISGPFSNQAINVALVPGTQDFVAINSVNASRNAGYYVHNERLEDRSRCGLGDVPTPHLGQIEYDGFSTVLTATLRLQPCQTYHIRLVVGDVSDAFFDSAVFLEAGSFNLGGRIAVTGIGQSAGSNQLYEGCDDAFFRFSREGGASLSHPLGVHYTLGGASTATEGEDFLPLPGYVSIPAGATYVDVPVHSLRDTTWEEDELLRVLLDIPCACYTDSADLYIVPPLDMELTLAEAYACPNEPSLLHATVGGGVPPYQYHWTTGSTAPIAWVTATPDIWYGLTITDACGYTLHDATQVQLAQPPSAQLSGSAQVCVGDTAFLNLQLQGIAPFYLAYTLDGVPATITLLDSMGFPAVETGQYLLTGITDAACTGTASGTGTVEVWDIRAAAHIAPPTCSYATDGHIGVRMTAGLPPFAFSWPTHLGDSTWLDQLGGGVYPFTTTDARGCVLHQQWEVVAPSPLYMPAVDCSELFGNAPLVWRATGGTAPYRYQIGSGPWREDAALLRDLVPGDTYQLHIQDAHGCAADFDWLAPVTYPDGMAGLPETLQAASGLPMEVPLTLYLPSSLLDSIRWTPAEQLSCSDCPNPSLQAAQPQVLQVVIADVFGCVDTLTTHIKLSGRLDVYLPNAFSPNGDNNNDRWRIYANPLQVERVEQVRIFDRWGGLRFEATDWPINSERHGWDGTSGGQPLGEGVYVYSVTFRLVNGQQQTLGGDILLLR